MVPYSNILAKYGPVCGEAISHMERHFTWSAVARVAQYSYAHAGHNYERRTYIVLHRACAYSCTTMREYKRAVHPQTFFYFPSLPTLRQSLNINTKNSTQKQQLRYPRQIKLSITPKLTAI